MLNLRQKQGNYARRVGEFMNMLRNTVEKMMIVILRLLILDEIL